MDIERSLVSRIARSQSMAEVIARNIEAHHFVERRTGDTSEVPLPGEVFQWMLSHLRRYRSVPSYDLTVSRWPLFEFADATDSIEALVEEMVKLINRREAILTVRELAKRVDDPESWSELPMHFFEAAGAMARAVPTSSITRFSDSLNRLKLYEEMERTGKSPGISFGVDFLDHLTYGVQRHEMAVIEGFLGQKKSSLAIAISAKNYFERGMTPLWFSQEMEGSKLAERWDAMAAGFHYSALKRVELTEGDKDQWKRIAEKAYDSKFEKDVLVIDDVRRLTEDRIYAEVERWRPDFSVVDTIDEVHAPNYLKSLHEKQDHVARELKGIARSTKRPMFVIAQANRDAATEGATLGNIAGSITIARKADVAIGLHADAGMKKMHQMEIRALKIRDDGGEGTTVKVYFDPGRMELRPWLPSDAVATK